MRKRQAVLEILYTFSTMDEGLYDKKKFEINYEILLSYSLMETNKIDPNSL